MKRLIILLCLLVVTALLIAQTALDTFRHERGPNENAGIRFDLDATTYGNQNDTTMTTPGVGDYIRVDVYAIEVHNLDTYEFEVLYNHNQLDYITATATNPITYEPNILTTNGGTALGWMIDTSTPGVLSIAYTLAGTDTLEAPEGEGLIADIVFQAITTTQGLLTFGEVHFYDSFGVMDIIIDKGIVILYESGNVSGTVTDSNTGEFIEGAIVSIENTTDITGPDGTYLLEYIPVGIYDINCTAEGYYDLTVEDVVVLENQTTTVDFPMEALSPIPPPNNLEASIVNYNDVNLEWQQPARNTSISDESRDLLGYKVYRDNEVIYETMNPDELTYDDLALAAAVYTYFVTAVYNAGESIPSNVETIEVILPVPQNPQAVTQQQDILVTWDAPTVRALSHYRVYRDLVQIADNIIEVSYLDENMPAGTYTYNITAVYDGGYESEMSPDAIINHEPMDANGVLIPIKTELYGNYPNPFNPETKIVFNLPEDSKVELSIYNIKGQKVKQLVSSQLSAGQHSVVWNGRDSNDKLVGSGIYFYKLKAGDYQKVRKMLLLK